MGLVHDIVEPGAKFTYRNLCTDDDPPRSVAICPQRRCVAFGCVGGIELHWVDALTGQDLNRWFPLTAPTDFLYFLPPRRGIDSAKKLRLISSAVHPEETRPLSRRFDVSHSSLACWGGTWGPRNGQSDHFQAVPLSDGYHILFTDPATGSLCLGSDAPLGSACKLSVFFSRKIWLIPRDFTGEPKEDDEEGDIETWIRTVGDPQERPRANVYAVGADLQHGVRVAAGYNDHVVFFSIPPDTFNAMAPGANAGEGNDNSNRRGSSASPEESIIIRGSHIGIILGLVDLAVDSGPGMSVYAFSTDGTVHIYQLGDTLGDRTPKVIKKVFGPHENAFTQTAEACSGPASGTRNGDLGCNSQRLPLDGSLSEAEDERSRGEGLDGMVCEVV
ncbi:hypothetical protein FN846DRAFT_783354 [Sphaerosporella brunnea]|uniref:Uncharacterized protein n=1 Tax=Sphaerosporella brunnea TaxID=1250544 RepID=A0A5J5END5_9PEZI|nr:hypothetical protein FN846DRAFT_783354 [Sphaerosporella brunnea]